MNAPSRDYETALKATQTFHTKQKGFNGRFLLRYLDDVDFLIQQGQVGEMLDYGCGRGEQYREVLTNGKTLEQHFGMRRLVKYDPGYPPLAAEPTGKFDLVICTQVLGSIPITDLPWVLDRIEGFSRDAVYIAEVLCEAPRKQLHAHLAGKMPHGWTLSQWQDVICAASGRNPGTNWYLRTKDKTVKKGARLLTTFANGAILNTFERLSPP